MANIDFPSSPSVGQKYTFNGVTYTYTSRLVWQADALGPLFTGPTGSGVTGATGPQYVMLYPGWFS